MSSRIVAYAAPVQGRTPVIVVENVFGYTGPLPAGAIDLPDQRPLFVYATGPVAGGPAVVQWAPGNNYEHATDSLVAALKTEFDDGGEWDCFEDAVRDCANEPGVQHGGGWCPDDPEAAHWHAMVFIRAKPGAR